MMFSMIKTCKKDPLKKSASKIPKLRGSEAFGKNPYLSHLIYFESFPNKWFCLFTWRAPTPCRVASYGEGTRDSQKHRTGEHTGIFKWCGNGVNSVGVIVRLFTLCRSPSLRSFAAPSVPEQWRDIRAAVALWAHLHR